MNRQTIEAEILDAQHSSNAVDPSISWDSMSTRTPAEIAMAAEEAEGRSLDAAAVSMIRVEVVRGLLDDFLTGWIDGRHSAAMIGKRVLAFAKYCDHRAVSEMTLEEIGELTGESKARTSKRILKECNERIEAVGGKSRARHQQSDEERAAQAERQKGNRCHRGGKKYDARLKNMQRFMEK